jgi:rhodanese-related sulfurtransferase
MEEFKPKKSAEDLIAEAESRIKSVSPDEIAEEVAAGEAVVIDVRELEEWRERHIPSAINVPRGWLELKADPDTPFFEPHIRPDRPIYVHCAVGKLGALATATLNEMGYETAANLEGGIEAWKAAGHPVERS